MRKMILVCSAVVMLSSGMIMAEPVPQPEKQCSVLMAQVENRLAENPPQDPESVETAKQKLKAARQAHEGDDARKCMRNIREAFKALNKT
ncbi:MAG: hypothetical protein CL583_08415 [Alteromonadaceae bacterium]|nr:hypothetical protein [Alteromonadaceae bacterium]